MHITQLFTSNTIKKLLKQTVNEFTKKVCTETKDENKHTENVDAHLMKETIKEQNIRVLVKDIQIETL